MPATDPFSDIIGHAAACEFLRRALSARTLGQALCFVGPSQVGKRTVAERLARALLGVQNLQTHPDFFAVRRESDTAIDHLRKEISVEQVRDLRSRLQLGSFLNSWKIAIIDDAHTLSVAGANALLKTVEEPTQRTLIIFVASTPDALPATIRSRCQVIRFRLVPDAVVARALEALCRDRASAVALTAIAAGRPGAALRLYQDAEWSLADASARSNALQFFGSPLHRRFKMIEELMSSDASPEQSERIAKQVAVWTSVLRSALAVACGAAEAVPGSPELSRSARRAGPHAVSSALRAAVLIPSLIKKNCNVRLCLEQFALSCAWDRPS